MAGDWIKMRPSLWQDPQVSAMADHLAQDRAFMCWLTDPLRMSCNASATEHVTGYVLRAVTVAALLRVWGAVSEFGKAHGESDAALIPCRLHHLDDIAEVPGMGEAMVSVGWAVEEDNAIVFPKYRANNVLANERTSGTNAERQKRYREKKAAESNVTRNVTRDVTSNDRQEQSKAEQTRQEETNASGIAPESQTQAALLALHECGVNGRNAAALVDGGVTAEEVQNTWASIRLNPKATNKQGVLVDALRKAHGVKLPRKHDGLKAGEAEAIRRIEQLARLRATS